MKMDGLEKIAPNSLAQTNAIRKEFVIRRENANVLLGEKVRVHDKRDRLLATVC